MLPIDMPNYPGAQVSPLQGYAKIAQALFGALGQRKLDKEQSALDTQTSAQDRSAMEALVNAAGLDPSVVPAGMSGNPANMALVQALIRQKQDKEQNDALMARNQADIDARAKSDEERRKMDLFKMVNEGEMRQMQDLREITKDANVRKADYTLGNTRFHGETNQPLASIESPQSQPADPFGNREVERNGKVFIQTYDKRDPQAKTLSEVEKGPAVDRNKTDNPLTQAQLNQSFLNISNRFQADPIMGVSTKGQAAKAIADQVIADPSKATNQMAALYMFVKNLDPDSAVREGETALAQRTQSYFDTFKASLTRLAAGQVLGPTTAKELAEATKRLIVAWDETASKRTKQYQSQADVTGVGEQFKRYRSGFETPQAPPAAPNASGADPLGLFN